MLRRPFPQIIAAAFLLTCFLRAECSHDYRPNKKAGIRITDFTITGTQNLSSTELLKMTGNFTGSCYQEDTEEMQERVRAMFQDEGYFGAEIKKLDFKPGDPLAVPKPVAMEAEVVEGPRYKLSEINFLKNRAFSSEKLRQEFPLKKGDVFSRGKVAGGLTSLLKVYVSDGYLDFMAIPDTQPASNATMNLNITFEEGPQYRLGTIEIVAKKEVAEKLRSQWKMAEGAVFDQEYVDQFIDANRDLLPTGFSRHDVERAKDCPAALVSLRLTVGTEGSAKPPLKDAPCESQ